MKFKFLSTAFKTLNDQNSSVPEHFQLVLALFDSYPLECVFPFCLLQPAHWGPVTITNTISMKHFLIHLVVINHLFSWAPIGFNLYFHPTFGPMFVLVNSVIRLASSREWTHNTNKCLNCWIQDMLATSNRKYVMGQTSLQDRTVRKIAGRTVFAPGLRN